MLTLDIISSGMISTPQMDLTESFLFLNFLKNKIFHCKPVQKNLFCGIMGI